MQTQLPKLLFALATIFVGLFGVTVYYGLDAFVSYETKFVANIHFKTDQNSNSNSIVKTVEPPTSQSSLPPSSLLPSIDKNEKEAEEEFGNITDHWISERSKKSYFISQVDDYIEMFENDSQHQILKVGKGERNKDKIVLKFRSTLDEVSGTLKLELSKDGKSMIGRFTALDDTTKEGVVRLIRSAS